MAHAPGLARAALEAMPCTEGTRWLQPQARSSLQPEILGLPLFHPHSHLPAPPGDQVGFSLPLGPSPGLKPGSPHSGPAQRSVEADGGPVPS